MDAQPQHSSQRSEPRSDRFKKCDICHKDGHFASDCLKNRKNRIAAAAHEQDEQPAHRRSNTTGRLERRDHDKREENLKTTTGASCQIEGFIKNGRLQLANGKSLPYAGALCNNKIRNDLPLCRDFVSKQPLKVLRDTGCNIAPVKKRKALIDESQLNGKISSCVLMDGTLRRLPDHGRHTVLHRRDKVDAMCMANPITT